MASDCVVRDNQLIDGDAILTGGGGVMLYGAGIADSSVRHVVTGNVVTNIGGGHVPYAVYEEAATNYNYIANNYDRLMETACCLSVPIPSKRTNIELP